MLYFDPCPCLKMLFHGDTPNGNDTFQRPVIRKRSLGQIKAYDMGQGEGLIVPLQSCTGRELPLNCMTAISA